MSSPENNGETVVGVGIDFVDHKRIREALERWGGRFKDRVFCAKEQSYCEGKYQPWAHYAGRFAVKEAVSKAFGTGIGQHLNWLDIEVVRDEKTGAPTARLSGEAWAYAKERGIRRILISLSHGHDHSIAGATLVGHCPSG